MRNHHIAAVPTDLLNWFNPGLEAVIVNAEYNSNALSCSFSHPFREMFSELTVQNPNRLKQIKSSKDNNLQN